MGIDFHNTVMGQRFFGTQLPKMLRSLERIADSLDQMQSNSLSKQPVEPKPASDKDRDDVIWTIKAIQDHWIGRQNAEGLSAEELTNGMLSSLLASFRSFSLVDDRTGAVIHCNDLLQLYPFASNR